MSDCFNEWLGGSGNTGYNSVVMSNEREVSQPGIRTSEDEFFCTKYRVWYPLQDCNTRVSQATYPGCVTCFQGRVNLRPPRSADGSASGRGAQLIQFPERRLVVDRKSRTFSS